MKKTANLFGTLFACFLAASLLFGAPVTGEESGGNERKGKYLFKNKCKQCHDPDKGQGEKKVTPSMYTKKQWESFFKRDKHKRKKDISDQFSAAELLDVQTFLINHAADSDQPETCG